MYLDCHKHLELATDELQQNNILKDTSNAYCLGAEMSEVP